MQMVGLEANRKGRRFILQSSPDSRKTNLISSDKQKMIKHKQFVTNNHILIQFDSADVARKDENGLVKSTGRAKHP